MAEHAQAALDLLPVGIVHMTDDGTIRLVNRMLCTMAGLEADELVGRNLFDLAVGDLDRYAQMFEFSTGYTAAVMGPLAVQYRRADGEVRHSTMWANNHLDDPAVGALVCTFVPESAEGSMREALLSVAEGVAVDSTLALLAAALRGEPFAAHGCWLVRDERGRRLAADTAITDSVRAALAQRGRWWRTVRGDDLLTCDDTRTGDEADRLLAAAGVGAWWAMPCHTDDADAALLVLRARPGAISPNQAEQLEQLATTATLAFERASMQARLAHAAFHDPLTGLGNRGRFFHREHREVAPGVALLSIDLDAFKPVNDHLGHAAGDLVLVTVADRIGRAVRPTDRITRFGGDEFVVECPGVGSPDEAVHIAERIIAAVAEPIHLDDACVRIGASVGIAVAAGETSIDELLDRSDAALLVAKGAGKGRWHLA
ncbi:MAG TPA: sensor domain-containing diguanylate cyclase [Acidimicrobiales bacterium]|nr:sensor domain-containing diguanylate cyclase [Acidimicrobiales bacterium]